MSAPPPDHVVADQSEVLALLGEPRTYGISEPVKRIDTHGAIVFLAGRDAYKVKRAVRFPFMDFSTPEKRRAACEAEIAINRPNAPALYLEALPVTRSAAGLKLGGEGEPVEWTVHMRRFDEARTLDHVAAAGGLDASLLARLTRVVLASHARAPRGDGEAATAALARYLADNDDAFSAMPELFPPADAAELARRAEALLAQVQPLLLARGAAGFVRRCHGDLHLRNLALIDGEPTLFDAIEFDETIATGDVLYDLAFLLMDLWERGLHAAASTVFNRYLWGSEEAHLSALAALPLFLSLRAAIRAKVTAAALAHKAGAEREAAADEALRYFRAALAFLDPAPARLVAVGGLSGSGKSTVAAALAPHLGRAPGAVHLRSDIERKRLFGVEETQALPAAAYAEAITATVYAALRHKAALVVRAGHAAVVDAVHARLEEREAIEATARALAVPFAGLWLEAPLAVLVRRVDARQGDASDADAAVVGRQASYALRRIDWHRLDASGPPAQVTEAALRRLGFQSSTLPRSQPGAA